MWSRSEMIFRAYQGHEGLSQLAAEWTALLDTMPNARFNHFPEWYRAYLSPLVSDAERVWFIAGYRSGKLRAVFPLRFQDHSVGMLRPRILGTLDDGQMQISDFIFAQTPENEGLLDELTCWLRAHSFAPWDELRLRKASDESSISYAARARLPKATVVLQYERSAYFRTDGTYERAIQMMTAKYRSNLRRRNRIATKIAPLTHRIYRRGDGLDEGFEKFLNIEASGWKGGTGTATAVRCQPAYLSFYQALVREFGARDGCVVNLLWHGDWAVAGQFCLHVGKTLSILKVGFSENHAIFAPGMLLLEKTIEKACEDPSIAVLDLVNDPPWAESFRPFKVGVRSYCTPNFTVPGMLVHLCLLAKRAYKSILGRAMSSAPDVPG
jgi:CelD/BcsL family acetyltransferase involved in cellulose biosynthesis